MTDLACHFLLSIGVHFLENRFKYSWLSNCQSLFFKDFKNRFFQGLENTCGGHENFRQTRADKYKHRPKASYVVHVALVIALGRWLFDTFLSRVASPEEIRFSQPANQPWVHYRGKSTHTSLGLRPMTPQNLGSTGNPLDRKTSSFRNRSTTDPNNHHQTVRAGGCISKRPRRHLVRAFVRWDFWRREHIRICTHARILRRAFGTRLIAPRGIFIKIPLDTYEALCQSLS